MANRATAAAKKLATSLTFRCLALLLTYAALITSMFLAVSALTRQNMAATFPSIDIFEDSLDSLEADDFASLRRTMPAESNIIIFDANGSVLYASSQEIVQQVSASDLDIIGGPSESYTFYEVIENGDSGGGGYTILCCTSDEEEGTREVVAWCRVTEDLVIIDGTLFEGKSSLTAREFNLIRGMLDTRSTIEKLEYETAEGEPRALVMVSPVASKATLERALEKNAFAWRMSFALAAALTLFATALLFKTIRRALRPLNRAIEASVESSVDTLDGMVLPIELEPTYRSFENLMEQLHREQGDKQRIIADVSHDLKTPLTVIRGYALALEEGRVPAEKEPAYLHAISAKSQEASEMLDALFAFAKMGHPSFDPHLERRDVCEVARQIAISHQAEVEQAHCILDADIDEEPIYVLVDESLLERAVGNLIVNAFRHNGPGTRIQLACSRHDDHARLSVRDTGSGFRSEASEAAFSPFVTSNSARASGKGTGLGLSIAQRCVEKNGGRIYIAEAPADGFMAEVVIELPITSS